MALAYLIREIQGLIDGLSMEELDYIAFLSLPLEIFFCWFHYTYSVPTVACCS